MVTKIAASLLRSSRQFSGSPRPPRRRDPHQQPSSRARRLAMRVGVFGRDAEIFVGDLRIVNLGHDRARHVLGAFDAVKGESGCREMQRIFGFNSFSRRAVPMKVPLVPSMETKWVIRPSVCCQISLAVPW